MHSQIILLQVQSKVRNSIAAMQALHDACQNFVNIKRLFDYCTNRMTFFVFILLFGTLFEKMHKNLS